MGMRSNTQVDNTVNYISTLQTLNHKGVREGGTKKSLTHKAITVTHSKNIQTERIMVTIRCKWQESNTRCRKGQCFNCNSEGSKRFSESNTQSSEGRKKVF